MRALLEKGNFLAIRAHTAKAAQRAAVQWAQDGLAACQGMELLVAGIGGLYVGLALAEKLDIPLLQAYMVPFTPTTAFPGALLPQSPPRLGGALNRLSHQLTQQMMWQGFRGADQRVRQDVLDLPATPFFGPYNSTRLRDTPVLYGFSPSILPKPADWDAQTYVTGYWFLESAADWTPPPDLVNFLEAGPLPVYIGFGSMGSRKPEETADLALQALARTGQRAILLAGWGGLSKATLPASVFMVDTIPHGWLFPRVAAVVHHGGQGPTAIKLRGELSFPHLHEGRLCAGRNPYARAVDPCLRRGDNPHTILNLMAVGQGPPPRALLPACHRSSFLSLAINFSGGSASLPWAWGQPLFRARNLPWSGWLKRCKGR